MIKKNLILLYQNKKKRNFFIYGLGQVFNLLSPLVVAPIIVSVCNVDGFGKVGLGFAMSLFLILIVDYAFDVKGTKLVSENRNSPKDLEKILSTTIFTKIVLFLISFFIAFILIFSFEFFYQEKKLFLLSLIIVFAQVFNPVWFLQGIENFSLVSILNIGSKSMYVMLVFFLIKNSNDYIYVNFFLGFSSLFFNLLGLFVIKYKYNFVMVKPKLFEIKQILTTDFSFCISQLFLSVRQLSPLVLTSYFLGFTIAGQYKVIEQVVNLFRTFIQVYLKFFYPSVCFKSKNDSHLGFSFWKKYSGFNVIFVSLMLMIIFIFSDFILRFFHLSERSIEQLSHLFKFSLLISLFMSISLPLEQLMFVKEKNKQYIKTTIFVTIINVIIILCFIKKLELTAVISSLIIAELFFILFYFNFTNSKIIKENE
jgi:O-antigen/teichoic acid export membrane protein